jgi:hypothetical protein
MWVGALLINTGDTHLKKMSTICISDSTATLPNGLSFNLLLSAVDSIQIMQMINVEDLDILLSASGPFHQVAKLRPENGYEKEPLDCLASFMDGRQQVAFFFCRVFES